MNDSPYTNAKDWYQFKHYRVHIEKYIYDVEHIHGTVSSSLDTSLSATAARLSIDETTKEGNPVYVEYGDEVTYKIKITNTVTDYATSPYYSPDDVYVDFEDKLPLKYSSLSVKDSAGRNVAYTTSSNGKIRISNIHLGPGDQASATVEYTIKLVVEEHIKEAVEINEAKIVKFLNINKFLSYTAEGEATDAKHYNTGAKVISADWYKLNDYKVEIDKYLTGYDEKILKENNAAEITDEDELSNGSGQLKKSRKDMTNENKKKAPVSVEKYEEITYTVEVRNLATTGVNTTTTTGNKPATQLRSIVLDDYMEVGLGNSETITAKIVKTSDGSIVHNSVGFTKSTVTTETKDGRQMRKFTLTLNSNYVVDPGQTLVFTITKTIRETNMYLYDLLNDITIMNMSNINDGREIKNASYDENTLPAKENSQEYVRMKDLVISGNVWVDINGNGLMDDTATTREQELYRLNSEAKKKAITVKLYYMNGTKEECIRTTVTDENGLYTFGRKKDLSYYDSQYTYNTNGTTNYASGSSRYQRIDKATNKDANGNYTADSTYIQYFIEFEYDGVVFKTTKYAGTDNLDADGKIVDTKPYKKDSNVKEFTTTREAYNEEYEVISYNTTYKSDTETKPNSTLEFIKDGHTSELYDKKYLDSDTDTVRLMTARSFVRGYSKAYVLSCIDTAYRSCGAGRWKQCSNHWRHWQVVTDMNLINPDNYPNTAAGRDQAKADLWTKRAGIASGPELTELTQYLWLYKYDSNDASDHGVTEPETEYLKYINCGLLLREDVDISLTKDVYQITTTINGERITYTINDTAIAKTATLSDMINYIIAEAYQFKLYESDYKYRVDQYPSEAVKTYKTDKSELNIEVTYKITLENNTTYDNAKATEDSEKTKNEPLGAYIYEIMDIYDDNFIKYNPNEEVTVKLRNKDTDGKTDGLLTDYTIKVAEAWYGEGAGRKELLLSNTAKYVEKKDPDFTNKLNRNKYNMLYIRPTEGDKIFIPEKEAAKGNSGKFELYVKYVVDKASLDIIVDNAEYISNPEHEVGKNGFKQETVGGETVYKQTLARSLKIKERGEKDGFGRSTENIAQIHAYSIWYTDASTHRTPTKPAGLVDKDANAGSIGDDNTTINKDANGNVTSITTPKTATLDNANLYEDNTYKTGVNITAKDTENPPPDTPPTPTPTPEKEAVRLMSGFVWDDARTDTITETGKGTQYIGDGKYDRNKTAQSKARKNAVVASKYNPQNRGKSVANYVSENKDTTVLGAKAEFVEIQKIEVDGQVRYYEQILKDVTWPEERIARTAKNGQYTLRGYIPGRYIVRFTYGDTTTGEDIKNSMIIYNGQDYKSTQYIRYNNDERDSLITKTGTTEKMNPDEVMTMLEQKNISDARDDEIRRLAVNGYSETMYNEKAEILKGFGTNPDIDKVADGITAEDIAENNKKLTNNTYMKSETMEFYTNVEKVPFTTEEVDYKTTTTYKVSNLDLGLEYRPESEVSLQMDLDEILVTTSSGKVLMDLKFDTIIHHENPGLTEHRLNKKKSVGTDYVQFVSNKYNKDLNSSTENTQGIVNLQVDQDMLQGCTIRTTYRVLTENNSEIDRITENLFKMRYKDDLAAGIEAKYALEGEKEYSASLTASNIMDKAYYTKDNDGIEYREDTKEYSTADDKGYFGRYVGHTYYAGPNGTEKDIISEIKVSKIANYVDNSYVYTQSEIRDLSNSLWSISNEEDITQVKENEYEYNLSKYINLVGNNKTKLAKAATRALGEDITKVSEEDKKNIKVLKDSKGILYPGVATSIDDRTTSRGDSESESMVQNKSLSRYLLTRSQYGDTDSNSKQDEFSGYIYIPVSRVISAESDTDELQFVNVAEIVEYMTLTGRRTNFESTIGDANMTLSKDTYKASAYPKSGVANTKYGTSEFLTGALEVDSAASEGIYLVPPTGLDRKRRVIVDAVDMTGKGIVLVVVAVIVVAVIGGITLIIKKQKVHKKKKPII